MKQRDLFYLNEIAKDGKIPFVNLTQVGDCVLAEATNGFCYMMIKEKNLKRFTQGFFKFLGGGSNEEVQLPLGYDILSSDGKKIASWQYAEPFDIRTGRQGEFTATFNREEMLYFLKYYLATWRRSDIDKFMLVFRRAEDSWHLRGYDHKKLSRKELPIYSSDTVTDKTFNFAVNPQVLRNIFKWFECENVTMYFQNGNYECKTPIFMRDNNKLAVLMPIARRQE